MKKIYLGLLILIFTIHIFPQTYIATAYCLKRRTASGEYVRSGVIAADTRLLPIGSKVRIFDSIFIVKDTGKDIKGNRIDIWMSSCSDAKKFGRKRVKVEKIS